MPPELDSETPKFALETWKTAIQVQQHFNTIEMQIRNLAVTVLTATIGLAGLVYNQTQDALRSSAANSQLASAVHGVRVFQVNLSSADMIIVGGLVAWLAFYFMDRWWYHRLLQGAVKQAQRIEDATKGTQFGELMSLSNSIRAESPIRISRKAQIHSNTKIDLFYGGVLVVLIIIIVFAF